MERQRIIIVDDEPTYRLGVAHYLRQSVPEAIVIAEASSMNEFRHIVDRTPAEIVIVSWRLVTPEDHQVIQRIATQSSGPIAVIAVCTRTNASTFLSAYSSGARAVLLRQGNTEDIAQAIFHIAGGEQYVSSAVGVTLLKRLSRLFEGATPQGLRKIGELTSREMEILTNISAGRTAKEIARILSLSVRTVENHRNNVMRKLGVHSTIGLIRMMSAVEVTTEDVSNTVHSY